MKKIITNTMKLEITATSVNEAFARATVGAFASQLDPTLDEINDIKTAVSEAVTNSIVHSETQKVTIECELWEKAEKNAPLKKRKKPILQRGISIKITDFGTGIQNIERALEPFYTTKPDQERSGMGFTVMQSFMDTLEVANGRKCGTIVSMSKHIGT